MGNVEYITTYQIDSDTYTFEYADYILDGVREMYPTKIILASIESTANSVLMSVYAKDVAPEIGYEFF